MRYVTQLWLASAMQALLVGCALTGCQTTSSPATSRAWPVAFAPVRVFDLRHHPAPRDTSRQPYLSYAQRRVILRQASPVNCCLEASAVRDSTYVNAYFYASVAQLMPAARVARPVLVAADMEEFTGLFLVLQAPGPHYASLLVASLEGTGGTEDDWHYEPACTVGRMLNDSLVQVKKGELRLAFPGSGQHSSTDTTTDVYRIHYRTATFQRISHQVKRTPVAAFF